MANSEKEGFGRGAQGLTESSRRAVQDVESGAQARAARGDREDLERQRRQLSAIEGDGAGEVGAAEDGRATHAPEED